MGCDIHMYYEVMNDEGKWVQMPDRHRDLSDLLYGRDSDENDAKMTTEARSILLEEFREHPLRLGRNYSLFAILALAEVRSKRIFAGIPSDDGFDPISEPRRYPEDISEEVLEQDSCAFDPEYILEGQTEEEAKADWKRKAHSWIARGYSTAIEKDPLTVTNPDHHSHSWYFLKELLDYDWDEKTTYLTGMVEQSEYEKWMQDDDVFSPSACSRVGGSFVKIIEEDEMKSRIEQGLPAEEEVTKTIHDEEITATQCYYCKTRFKTRYSDRCRHFVDGALPYLRGYADSALGGDYERLRLVFWFDN